MKAVFAVSLVVPDHLLAASKRPRSTAPTSETEPSNATFADTMVMSTYLVALVVGPLGRPTRMIDGTDRSHCGSSTRRGPRASPRSLRVADAGVHLGDYYDIAYPGDKIDLVPSPTPCLRGDVENLGLDHLPYEIALLVDPDEATQP